ncbi:MAG: RIP metalloprotease RseP [Deltaproteobacteria bacterium]|nr:RIP metalloprotease RseP [Deltaproteobacteria bacterium]
MITMIISVILVLGVLIFVHELGHFAMAKYCGVGVETFSLGFGKKIFSFKRGETEYCLSILPLGGYVKMVGDNPEEALSLGDSNMTGDEMEQLLDNHKAKSFLLKPLSSRIAIVAAGPIMNLALAFLIYPITFLIGVSSPAYMVEAPIVGYVMEGEAAEQAGFKAGDEIIKMDNIKVGTWEKLNELIGMNPGNTVSVVINRNGTLIDTTLTPHKVKEQTMGVQIGVGGFAPPMEPRIGGVVEGKAADKSGLLPGDLIKAIDGKAINHWIELPLSIGKSGSERTFTIDRAGKVFDVLITPVLNVDYGAHLIGVTQTEETITRSYGLVESVKLGFAKTIDRTILLCSFIKGLVMGKYSLGSLGGPILIAQVSGKMAESGLSPFLAFAAFLSLNLGILNFLPIPVLDGGFLVFFGLEWMRGKPLSDGFMIATQNVGFFLLIGLMLFVTWNDLVRVVTSWG